MRYWDGQTWSPAVAPSPVTAPQLRTTTGPPRKRYGWLLALAAVAVTLILVVALVVSRAGRSASDPVDPGGTPSTEVCPQQQIETPKPRPADGRVHGGKLSYPLLGPPWSVPRPEYGVAFARAVLMQTVLTERNSPQGWYASVMVGQLSAGDGFFSPRDGAAIVVKCVSGTFYGHAVVTRDDQRNQAIKVDGHDAWEIESQLHYDLAGVAAKQELLIVVIVDTGDGAAGLFYASVPQNAPQLVQPARAALAALRVDG